MTEWRYPDSVVDEAKYRLDAFKFPSFDRVFVEKLLAEIEEVEKARKANVETCVSYAKRIEELRQEVVKKDELIESFVLSEIEYMTRNNLGDPELQHNVKWARQLGIDVKFGDK